MTDSTALDSFLDKWRMRWPEWRVVEIFVPEAQRQLAVAWFSLLQEFTDGMNIAGDPLPADAKLAWWGEELRDWQQQRSRHPLGRVLEPHRAPWFELAEALPALQRLRERPRDAAAAWEIAKPLATAIAAVEAVLFGAKPSAQWVQAIQAQLLFARLESAGVAALPLQIGRARENRESVLLADAGEGGDDVKGHGAFPRRRWREGRAGPACSFLAPNRHGWQARAAHRSVVACCIQYD